MPKLYGGAGWRALKAAAWRRSGGKCERCKAALGSDAHLHHLTYANAGSESLDDVILICVPCHGHFHPRHTFRTAQAAKSVGQRRKHKAKVVAAEPHWDDINGAFASALKEREPYVRLAVRMAAARKGR